MMKKPRFSVHSLVPHYSRETRKLNGQARSNSTIYRNDSDQRIAPTHSLHSPFPLLPLLSSLSLLLPPLHSTQFDRVPNSDPHVLDDMLKRVPFQTRRILHRMHAVHPSQTLISSRNDRERREWRKRREGREKREKGLPWVRISELPFCQTSRRISSFRERSKVGTSKPTLRFDYSLLSARVRK